MSVVVVMVRNVSMVESLSSPLLRKGVEPGLADLSA